MSDAATLAISVGSMLISLSTAWLTLLRGGRLRVTQPTLFYMGPDGGGSSRDRGGPKIFIRAMLYSSGQRGNMIENMYVTVRRGETRQNFNVWVYRDAGNLSRGSGLFVGQAGVALDHHFLLPRDNTSFSFTPGEYAIELYAQLIDARGPQLLTSMHATLPADVATQAETHRGGVFFDWGPDLGRYHANARPLPPADDVPALVASALDGLLPPRMPAPKS